MQSNGLTAVRRTGATEEVRLQLERAVRTGAFAPGERLPSERELADTFGVSRVAVREAVRSLVAIGLITVQHGRGAFVLDRRSGVAGPMARWLELHRDEVLELHDVRGALDELAGQLAAQHDDPETIRPVIAAHEAFIRAREEGASLRSLAAMDIEFHVSIAEASKNRLLYDLLSDLHTYLAEMRHITLERRLQRFPSDHRLIVEAIVARDPERARAMTAAHVARVRTAIVASIQAEVAKGALESASGPRA